MSDLGALLYFDKHNIRYITATHNGTWAMDKLARWAYAGHIYIARHTFPLAVQVIESGRLALDVLITHRIPLRDSHSGIDLLRRGDAVKVIINQFGMGDARAEYPATHWPESR